jgi:hypothetical protein
VIDHYQPVIGSKTVPLEAHDAEVISPIRAPPAWLYGTLSPAGKPAARPVYQARGPSGPAQPGLRGAARLLSPAREDFSKREFICFIRTKFRAK